MGIKEFIDKIKGTNNIENEETEELEPIRDRQLEHLEREFEFHQMQDRKEKLKKVLALKKKQQLRDHLFGKLEKEKSYLGEHLTKKKVNVMAKTCDINKCPSMISNSSLLNERKRQVNYKKYSNKSKWL